MNNPSNKPPFNAIFDFSFTEFISIDLIRVLYVFAFLIAGVATVGALLAGFSNGLSWFIGSLIMAPLLFFVIVFISRIFLEMLVVLFRIAENTRETADNTKTE